MGTVAGNEPKMLVLELLCRKGKHLIQGIFNFYSDILAFALFYVCMFEDYFFPYIIEVKYMLQVSYIC